MSANAFHNPAAEARWLFTKWADCMALAAKCRDAALNPSRYMHSDAGRNPAVSEALAQAKWWLSEARTFRLRAEAAALPAMQEAA